MFKTIAKKRKIENPRPAHLWCGHLGCASCSQIVAVFWEIVKFIPDYYTLMSLSECCELYHQLLNHKKCKPLYTLMEMSPYEDILNCVRRIKIETSKDDFKLDTSKFTKLTTLIADTDTNITDNCLKYLENIKILSLKSNKKITGAGIFHIRKTIVELYIPEVENLSDWVLRNLVNIEKLDILSAWELESDSFKYLEKLKMLTCATSPDCITEKAFAQIPNLKVLDIDISHGGFRTDYIKPMKGLEILNINDNYNGFTLKHGGDRFPNLRELRLEVTSLKLEHSLIGLRVFISNYAKNANNFTLGMIPNVEILWLPLCKNITNLGLQRVANVKVVNLIKNGNIGDDGLKDLWQLEELRLGGRRNITDRGLKYIGSTIERLCLAKNRAITDNGLHYLKKIKKLNLNANRSITNYGISCLNGIEELYILSAKDVDGEGLRAIKGSIKRFKFYIPTFKYGLFLRDIVYGDDDD